MRMTGGFFKRPLSCLGVCTSAMMLIPLPNASHFVTVLLLVLFAHKLAERSQWCLSEQLKTWLASQISLVCWPV
jgi:hypothetical protein